MVTFWVEENDWYNEVPSTETPQGFLLLKTSDIKKKNTNPFHNRVVARLVIKPCTECLCVESNCLRSKTQHTEINKFAWLIVNPPVTFNESKKYVCFQVL